MSVTVQLRRVPEGASEYESVAELKASGRQWEVVQDPEGLLPLDLPVLVVKDGQVQRLGIEEDAEIWARNLSSILRTGYLVPVVVSDDDAG